MPNGLNDDISLCLKDAFDLHVHSAPDVMPRKGDDLDFARRAASAGMGGLVLKSHHVPTADRATLINRTVAGIKVYGAIVLNNFIGGLNVQAVDVAGRLGAKIVWMPTVDSQNESKMLHSTETNKLPYWAKLQRELATEGHLKPPVQVIMGDGSVSPDAIEILDLVKQYGMILATGHLSPAEPVAVIKAAKTRSVERIILTHPEFPTTRFSISEQEELLPYGVYFERCYTTAATGKIPWGKMLEAIKRTGPGRNIISTDLGQPNALYPDEGLGVFSRKLLDFGFPVKDVTQMISSIPRELLQ